VNRKEATGVLSKVVTACGDFVNMDFVSITDSTAEARMKSTGYEIYMKCTPSEGLRQCLIPILEQHSLKMAELNEAIIIYKPKTS
jgi:hypothetical protein